MSLQAKIQKVLNTLQDHEPVVTLVGQTDYQNFKIFWEKAGLEDVMDDMDANASKAGLSTSPVFVTIVAGKNGHLHAQISVPLQKRDAGLRVDDSVLQSKNLQRVTDWVAGFMETFSANGSVNATDLRSGTLIFGDSTNAVENSIRDISPKKDKSELMTDSLDIGSVEDILSGQMSQKEIDEIGAEEKDAIEKAEAQFSASTMVEDLAQKIGSSALTAMKEVNDETDKDVQQEIFDKYGAKALKDLLKRTNRPLLIDIKKK